MPSADAKPVSYYSSAYIAIPVLVCFLYVYTSIPMVSLEMHNETRLIKNLDNEISIKINQLLVLAAGGSMGPRYVLKHFFIEKSQNC